MASNNLFFFPFLSIALLQGVFAVDTIVANNSTGKTRATRVSVADPIVVVANNTGVTTVDYFVTNNASDTRGGIRFDNVIGENYSQQTLVAATAFIWNIFQQRTAADRKNVQKVSLFIDRSFDGVAFTTNNEIHVGANYISNYAGDVKREITGILYHEMTHIWQWNGNSTTPGGLIEGIADYVRLKSGYIPGQWVSPGGGSRWDQGYDVTARFLEYLEGVKSGFVAELNRRLRNGYSADYFRQFSGKTVDELWAEYKSSSGNNVDKKCSYYEIEVNGVFALQL